MKNHWLDQAKQCLQAEAAEPSDAPFDRLRAEGMINDRGEVTGQLHRWNAFLAITEVRRVAGGRQIEAFRCLKPVFGMPGGALIDISRDSMVDYLKEGKKVIELNRFAVGKNELSLDPRQPRSLFPLACSRNFPHCLR